MQQSQMPVENDTGAPVPAMLPSLARLLARSFRNRQKRRFMIGASNGVCGRYFWFFSSERSPVFSLKRAVTTTTKAHEQ